MEDVRIEAAEANLGRLLEWISRVDNKVAFSFLAGTAMLGTLVTSAPSLDAMGQPLFVLACLTGILLLMNAACIMLVAFPRTRDPDVIAAKPSVFFFGTTARMPLADYRASFRSMSEAEMLDDLLMQCHVNSKILAKKFHYLRGSYIFLYLAALPWTACLLFFVRMGEGA